jgi:hypothetical protein
VLIKQTVLERIATGEIDTLFRRQKRPTVRTGGTLRTAIGMLDIVSIEAIDLDEITPDDAARGGFESVAAVVADLTQKPEGAFYRVRVRTGAVDPRDTLRAADRLTPTDLDEVRDRLDRLDAAGGRGPWTRTFLMMIRDQPHVRAPDLAASIGWETKPFKDNVRKLKALGLTISHNPGYELSPRGHAVVSALHEAPDGAPRG